MVWSHLAGSNTRRLRGALAPLLKAAPLSKSAVSRIIGTLKAELETWRARSLAGLDVFGMYLDAIALRVRSAGKVVSVPVLGVVAILTDGQKQLVALDLNCVIACEFQSLIYEESALRCAVRAQRSGPLRDAIVQPGPHISHDP